MNLVVVDGYEDRLGLGISGRPIVAVDDQVVVEARLLAHRQQFVEGHGQVMVLDEDLPLELEPWQAILL